MKTTPPVDLAALAAIPPPPPTQTEVKEFSLRELAYACALETNGDTADGAQLLLKRLREEFPDAYEKVKAEVLQKAVLLWAQDQMRKARAWSRGRSCPQPAVLGPQSVPLQPLHAASLGALERMWRNAAADAKAAAKQNKSRAP